MSNIFLKNHAQNVKKQLVPEPFSKKAKLSKSLDLQSEVSYNLFLYKVPSAFFYFTRSSFKKQKRSGTSLPTSFLAWFLKKNISQVKFYQLTKFHSLIAITSWEVMAIQICNTHMQYVYCNYMLCTLQCYKFWNLL